MRIFKHSLFRLKITVGCRLCKCPSIRVCVLCVLGCVLGCVCGVRCGAAWHAEKPPCVGSKRLRVQVQNASVCASKNARMFNMRAFCQYTRKRFEPTHGYVSNLHTGRRKGEKGGSLLSLSRPFSLSLFLLLSLFRRSLHSFSFSFSSPSLFSSLSVTMTMITRPVGSLCVHSALTCQSVRAHGPWPIPCWPNMFGSCKKQLSWHDCASFVPLGMKWACICAGNGCCVLVVFGCVSLW